MGGTRSTPGRDKCVHNYCWKNLKGRDLCDLRIDGRIILERIVEKQDGKIRIRFV
jgi:hypothetical protein